MNSSLTKASKYMALILRHEAQNRDVPISPDGYVLVKHLLAQAKLDKVDLTQEILDTIILSDTKGRYGYHPTTRRLVRAHQGHSIESVTKSLQPQEPPVVLYHGTGTNTLAPILQDGIASMRRNQVHLTENLETAKATGARHGKPVILIIDAAAMYADKFEFLVSSNDVWLTEYVPRKYITGTLYP